MRESGAASFEVSHARARRYRDCFVSDAGDGGKAVSEAPRHVVLTDTVSHLAPHRGRLTVYLRLLEEKGPAIYGPSADDQRFA